MFIWKNCNCTNEFYSTLKIMILVLLNLIRKEKSHKTTAISSHTWAVMRCPVWPFDIKDSLRKVKGFAFQKFSSILSLFSNGDYTLSRQFFYENIFLELFTQLITSQKEIHVKIIQNLIIIILPSQSTIPINFTEENCPCIIISVDELSGREI